jgi:hypothetical protein
MSWSFQPVLPAAAEILATPPVAGGYFKVWTGAEWVAKPAKVWNGSVWEFKPVKFWDGASWVTATSSP